MNTRKILYLTMLIAMLLGTTACQQEDDPTVGKVKVTFIAELPDLPERIDSRAIGDGDYANELFLWVYDDEGREIPGLRQRNIGFQGKIARVTVYLTPGHTYGFAFWAQHKDILSYVPGNSLINMYYDVDCNDETRDAFWNWIPNLEVGEAGEITQDIILVRRLSQVNCGITLDAYLEAKRAGVDLKDYDSELILESTSEQQPIAYDWFNVVDGKPITYDYDHMLWELDFAKSPMPNEPLHAGGDDYMYLALSYFQPLVDKFSLANATLVLHHKLGLKPDITYTWPNSRFKGNYRTNLLIRSLTESVQFDVIIDQNFANQDYNYDTDGNPLQ